ncbi:MAG: hypothetical protein KDD70_06665 [Bdellovibrionales bacterium]|nr:hypothetical protein [Bdellovibrionales bacterium]
MARFESQSQPLSKYFENSARGHIFERALGASSFRVLHAQEGDDLSALTFPNGGKALVLESANHPVGALVRFEKLQTIFSHGEARFLILDAQACGRLQRNDAVKKQLELIAGNIVEPAPKLLHEARLRNRAARDDSLEQCVKLRLLEMTSPSTKGGPESLIDILPPGRVSSLDISNGSSYHEKTWQARAWKLVDNPEVIIGWMLLGEDGLRGIAKTIQREAEEESGSEYLDGQRSIHVFIDRVQKQVQEIFKDKIPSLGFDKDLFASVSDPGERFNLIQNIQTTRLRAAQLMWLSALDNPAKQFIAQDGLAQSVQRRLGMGPEGKPNWPNLMKYFDDEIEPYFTKKSRITELQGMDTHSIGMGFNLVSSGVTKLARDAMEYQQLDALRHDLENGGSSAVGGKDYAVARFLPSCLDAFAEGKMKLVIHDGDHGEGVDWIIENYGNQVHEIYDLHDEAKVYDLRGMYGSFKRSLVTLRDGQQFVLVSAIGRERQISLGAAALLHTTYPGNERGSVDDILLTKSPKSSKQRMHEELSEILLRENSRIEKSGCLNIAVASGVEVPTWPSTFMHGAGGLEVMFQHEAVESMTYKSKSFGKIEIRYVEHRGELRRLINVGIGSHGVYGSTAGEFVEVLRELESCNLVGNAHGVSTAGGLIGSLEELGARGLKGIPHGARSGEAYILPEAEISDVHTGEKRTINKVVPLTDRGREIALEIAEHQVRLKDTGLLIAVDRHGTVSCPAVETDRFVTKAQESLGIASIDVEGIHIQKASDTFFVTYFLSDDPVAGAHEDRYATYARMSFFAEHAPPSAEVYQLHRKQLELEFENYWATTGGAAGGD